MTDFLDEKRKEIDARLRELGPLVDEHRRLEKAAAALEGVDTKRTRVQKRPGKAATRRRGGGPTGRRGRPRGTGQRAAQAKRIVTDKPGITIPELADEMGIQANYLYRVMPTLQKEGQVKKRDKGWHPA